MDVINKILAIDCSIRGTGICMYDMNENLITLYTYQDKRKKSIEFTTGRFHVIIEQMKEDKEKLDYFIEYIDISNHILNKCLSFLNGEKKVFIVIEGYAFNKTGKVFNIAEFTGITKKGFYDNGYVVNIIEPSVVKKKITGKGNANKLAIYESLYANDSEYKAVLDKLKNEYKFNPETSPVNDLTDAYSLMKSVIY